MSKQRSARRILSPAILVWAVLAGVLNAVVWHGHQQTDDWSSLWIAGLIAHGGDSASLYEIDLVDFARWSGPVWERYTAMVDGATPHPFIHLPIVAYALGALSTVMTYPVSVTVLTFLQGFCLVVLVASAYFLWWRRTAAPSLVVPLSLAVWLSPAAQMSSHIGQTSPLIFAGITYGLAAARIRRGRAGIIRGSVGAINRTPLALLLPLVLYPSTRRAAAWMGASASAMFVGSLAGGLGVIAEWARTVRWIGSSAVVDSVNQAFSAVVLLHTRELPQGVFAPILRDIPLWVEWTPKLIAVLLGIGLCWAAWLRPRYGFEILSIGGLAVATLASNILWTHYMLIAVPIIAGLVALTRPWTQPIYRVIAVLSALCVVAFYPPLAPSVGFTGNGFTVIWSSMVGLLVITVLLICGGLAGPPKVSGGKHRVSR